MKDFTIANYVSLNSTRDVDSSKPTAYCVSVLKVLSKSIDKTKILKLSFQHILFDRDTIVHNIKFHRYHFVSGVLC